MQYINNKTALSLKMDWMSPTAMYPSGTVASVEFWANQCGMSTELFIQKFEADIFIVWFRLL
jgi:hypothetical protein